MQNSKCAESVGGKAAAARTAVASAIVVGMQDYIMYTSGPQNGHVLRGVELELAMLSGTERC